MAHRVEHDAKLEDGHTDDLRTGRFPLGRIGIRLVDGRGRVSRPALELRIRLLRLDSRIVQRISAVSVVVVVGMHAGDLEVGAARELVAAETAVGRVVARGLAGHGDPPFDEVGRPDAVRAKFQDEHEEEGEEADPELWEDRASQYTGVWTSRDRRTAKGYAPQPSEMQPPRAS